MKDTERQLEEANEAMQEFCDRCDKGEVRSTYTYNKFKALLKPGATLFEKFEKFMDYLHPNTPIKYESTFEKFKEIFADDLNGTKGLDKVIEYCEGVRDYGMLQRLKTIKKEAKA